MRNLINPLDQNQFDYAEILSITLRVAIAAARMQMAHTIGTYRVLSQKHALNNGTKYHFYFYKRCLNVMTCLY